MPIRPTLLSLLLLLSAVVLPADATTPVQFHPATQIATGFQDLQGLSIADFNGDGRPDLAVTDLLGTSITVYLNRGDGTFGTPILTHLPFTGSTTTGPIVTGDFNEDGKADLILATLTGPAGDILLTGNGDGTFTQGPTLPNSFGFLTAVVADLNHDGHLDLVAGGNGTLYVHLGDGTGNFTEHTITDPPGGAYFALAVADFNSDGKLDIMASTNSGYAGLHLLAGAGDGTFAAASTISNHLFHNIGTLSTADLNGDGKADLLVSVPVIAFGIFGHGDGTFDSLSATPTTTAPVVNTGTPDPPAIATGDLNGDGKPDIVSADNTVEAIQVYLNDGSGTFTQPDPDFRTPTADGSNHVQLADLNHDGLLDIVVSNYRTGILTILLSTPAQQTPAISLSSAAPQLFAGSATTVSVVVAGTSPIPSGTVTLLDGTTSLGQQTLDSTGHATFAVASLAVGTHSLTASYAGDTSYLPATSPSFPQAVTDFQLASTAGVQTQSVARGSSAAFPITLTGLSGFSGTLSFTCSGLPTGYGCSSTPAILSGATATATVTVSTPATASLSRPSLPWLGAAPVLALALLLLPPLRHRPRCPQLLLLVLSASALTLLAGCSGSSPAATTTPAAQTTTFTITATATQGTQVLAHTTSATITVH